MYKIKTAFTIFSLLALAFLFLGNAGGVPGNRANAPGDNGFCSTCHTSSAAGSIQLVGAPSTYTAGQSYNMTIVLANATAVVGGFQIVATNGLNNTQVGDFIPTAGTTLNDVLRLVQSTPKSFVGGTATWDITWQAPASGAPANVQFYFAGNAANGNMNNGTGDFAFANTSGLIALPVNLLSFEAKERDGKINIEWQAEDIEQHSHFEIQHSLDGKSFETIAEVTTEDDNERNTFEYLDEDPAKGATHYYRLKSVDTDATYFYSEVRSVRLTNASDITIYPNPIARGQNLHIAIDDFKSSSDYEVKIFNTQTQLVRTTQLSSPQAQLTINQLNPGLYTVQLIKDGIPVLVERILLL